jgi:hypothetical protein
MGLFLATTVTGVILLLAVMAKVSAGTIIFRVTVIFFIFGLLGTVLGSFLEVLLMPITTEKEQEKLKEEMIFEDSDLKEELGDLLEDTPDSLVKKTYGTPTDELMTAVDSDMNIRKNVLGRNDSAIVS